MMLFKPHWNSTEGETKQHFCHSLWSTGKCKQCQTEIKRYLPLFWQLRLPLTEKIDWTHEYQVVLLESRKRKEKSGVLFWKKSLFCPTASSWINLVYSSRGNSRKTCPNAHINLCDANFFFVFVLCFVVVILFCFVLLFLLFPLSKRNNIVSVFLCLGIITAHPGARCCTERNFAKEL